MLAGQMPRDQFDCLWPGYYSMITYLNGNIWKLVKVARIIDGSDGDRDGGGPLPDVLPVHAPEPGPALDVLQTLDPLLPLVTEPARRKMGHSQRIWAMSSAV